MGTAAVVVQVTGTNWPKPAFTLLVTGLCRFKVDDVLQESPYVVAKVTQMDKLEDGKHEFHETCHSKVCCDTTTPESIHTKDESKRDSAFAYIFGVN